VPFFPSSRKGRMLVRTSKWKGRKGKPHLIYFITESFHTYTIFFARVSSSFGMVVNFCFISFTWSRFRSFPTPGENGRKIIMILKTDEMKILLRTIDDNGSLTKDFQYFLLGNKDWIFIFISRKSNLCKQIFLLDIICNFHDEKFLSTFCWRRKCFEWGSEN
jgi:hypothetical protein